MNIIISSFKLALQSKEDHPRTGYADTLYVQSVCWSEIRSPHTRPAGCGSAILILYTFTCGARIWLRAISVIHWMTEMDLPSLHLQFRSETAPELSQKGWQDEISRFLCSCDLDLDPMTSIYDMSHVTWRFWRLYMHTKKERSRSKISKVVALQTDRHADTHRCDRTHYYATLAVGNEGC